MYPLRKGGTIASGSNKHNLNAPSSTEAVTVVSDDLLPKTLWVGKFAAE